MGRVDREAYFNAAFKILAASGFQELTVDNLCASVGASKGSFYHHFTDTAEFTSALVSAWEATVNEIFSVAAAAPTLDGIAQSLDMLRRWPLQADASIRGWARANAIVGAAVQRQEAAWERMMRDWLELIVPDPERCSVLAHMLVAVVVGMLAVQRPPDPDRILAVCLEILQHNIGLDSLPDGM